MAGLFERLRFLRDHHFAPKQMSEYIEGDLQPSARERVERHLAECEDCDGLLGSLRAIVAGLADIRTADPVEGEATVGPAVLAGVRAGMEGEEDHGRDV